MPKPSKKGRIPMSTKRKRRVYMKKHSNDEQPTSVEQSESFEEPTLINDETIEKTSEITLEGRRILDIQHFLDSIKNQNHGIGFDCSIRNMEVISERRIGLKCVWTMRCNMCGIRDEISSEKDTSQRLDANKAAVSSTISSGSGFTVLNEILSGLEIPALSFRQYSQCEENLSEGIKDATWETMEKAAAEEKELAIKNGDVDADGIPFITVIADGQWSKRSYKTKYNALSGLASIIGARTGKIIFVGVRNKYCSICAQAKKNAKDVRPHKCYKNWNLASTAMEADIIAEGFSQSIEMHGLKYTRLIGDGDSSVYSRLRALNPYGTTLIEKVECKNHLMRNFSKKLTDLSTKVQFPARLRKELLTHIVRIRRGVNSAIKHHLEKGDEIPKYEKLKTLRTDIDNAPYHVFGQHDNCREYFCKGASSAEENLVPELIESGLFKEIGMIMKQLSRHSSSLLENASTNRCEQFNSIVNKYISGKRINYSSRGSYEMRVKAAVLSFNTGEYQRIIHKKLSEDKSPGKFSKLFLQRKKKVALACKRRRLEFPRKKGEENVGADEFYGLAEPLPISDEEELEERKNNFLRQLRLDNESIMALEQKTREQSDSIIWQQERRKRLTASNFGKICRMRSSTLRRNTVHELLYASQPKSKAIEHGKFYESQARGKFEELYKLKALTCGMFVSSELPFLAASPDGLVGNDAILEIKCPFSAFKSNSIHDAVVEKKITFCQLVGDEVVLKRNSPYFYQIQGQLAVTRRSKCYFVVFGEKWLHCEEVMRDENFWEDMVPLLTKFYMDCLLPELVDPKFGLRLCKGDIREPQS